MTRHARIAPALTCIALIALWGRATAEVSEFAFQADLRAMVDRIAETSVTILDSEMLYEVAAIQPSLDSAFAQVDPNRPELELNEADDTVTLNFQDTDIRALINTIAQITGKNFIVDPRVKGKITLVSGGKLSADQVYDVFLSVLDVHNFAAIPSGGVVKVLPNNLVKQTPTPTQYKETAAPNDQQITQIYSLQHSSVQEMVPILRPLLPPTSHFAAHAGTNTLIFTDTAANTERIVEIIRELDQPARRSEVHVVFLEHAGARDLATILTQFATNIGQVTGVEGGVPPTQANQIKGISIQADPAINALIIQSPDVEYQFLRAIIDQLDIERPETGDIHVVYLKYAKATELVTILNEVGNTSGAAGEGEGGGPPAVAVSVQADEGNNALVIRANREDFLELKTVIEKLDLRRAQVFVEAIIAEVSVTKQSQLGVEWQGTYSQGDGGEVNANTDFSDQSGGLRLGFINKFIRDITGQIVPDINIVLRALRSDSNTNILATPNLLTLDNETAEIIVGQEVPFVTGSFVSDASTSATVPDGGGGAVTGVVNPFQTVERKDVGLTLRITPQINEGGAIRLEIEEETSQINPFVTQALSDVVTDRRSIKATVLVDDGQIIVLGGLIQDDFEDTVEWVPVLGRIPVLGALFRKKTRQATKNNLMVFLVPKIIRTPEDLAAYTRDRYEFLRSEEQLSLPDSPELIPEEDLPVLPALRWPGDSRR